MEILKRGSRVEAVKTLQRLLDIGDRCLGCDGIAAYGTI